MLVPDSSSNLFSPVPYFIRNRFGKFSWIGNLILAIVAMLTATAIQAQTPEDTATEPAVEPSLAEKTFQVPDGLDWKLLLSEPLITQPLMTTFDSHGRLWVIEYRQYPNPEGLRVLSRDRHWRVVYDSVPKPPGQGGLVGKDRISIHEDKDHDGKYETHHVFVDGLNIATAVAPVHQGAWVLNPPFLLYYPDQDEDLRADGPPTVHLEGFGLEDTHSVVNSLIMGPDGWLYGAQGSTVSGAIKRYGSADKPIQSLGQAIWRYHPQTHQYEVFAEGGGNAFGVAFDDRGEIFSGHNGGDTRGFHYYQGGYYRKGFSKHGSLSNPHSYGYLEPMQHDPIPRFTHTMLITESTALDKFTPNSMLAVDPLHGKLIQTERIPVGSTYKTKDIADTISSTDKWYRPVAISDSPDGSAIVSDWYDSVVAHLYAFEGRLDRDRGRVYRLAPAQSTVTSSPISNGNVEAAVSPKPWDSELAHGDSPESLNYLLQTLEHPYRWQRWMARRLIAEHPLHAAAIPTLKNRLLPSDGKQSRFDLEALWTLHALGAIPDTIPFHIAQQRTDSEQASASVELTRLLNHPNADVRSWTVRLVCDDGTVSDQCLEEISSMAAQETDPHALCQLACSARRLDAKASRRIVASLLAATSIDASKSVGIRGESDPFFPLLTWWSIEKHAEDFDGLGRELVARQELWKNGVARKTVFPNLVRRWASIGSPEAYLAISQLLRVIAKLDANEREEATKRCQESFEAAFVGRSLAGVPDAVIDAMAALGQPPLTLQVRRGDPIAFTEATKRLKDSGTPEAMRMQLARLAGELKEANAHPELLEALFAVAGDAKAKSPIRVSALSAMSNFDDDAVASNILTWWSSLPSELRPAAGSVLSTRPKWIDKWLDAVQAGLVDSAQMPPESIRTMRLHPSESIQKRLAAAYPEFASVDLATATQKSKELAARILDGNGDPYRGKKLYRELCGRCHHLFDDGGQVGPDLTGYQRDQLETLLRNIVGPSLEIREGYQMVRIMTADSLVLTGFIESEQADQVVLRNTDGQSITLDRSDIEQLEPQVLSLMPEGLLDKLDDGQLRDLMAYLRSSQPLNDGT